jgi:hypothetical protein
MDKFVLGKEKSATDLIDIIQKIPEDRHRIHNYRWAATLLQKFNRGYKIIKVSSDCYGKMELAITWRNEWLRQVGQRNNILDTVRSHIRSIIIGRTRNIIRDCHKRIEEIKENYKKGMKKMKDVPGGGGGVWVSSRF